MAKARPRPDPAGYFGLYGGRFVPETLMAPLAELLGGVRVDPPALLPRKSFA